VIFGNSLVQYHGMENIIACFILRGLIILNVLKGGGGGD